LQRTVSIATIIVARGVRTSVIARATANLNLGD
jgi:hypothetical protein